MSLTHSLTRVAGAVVVSGSGAGLPRLPQCHCSSFQREKLYFHCQAMKCLCMTAEHTTINLTPAELTGQKPMQPLLGTEHYQCMDSLFIRGSIRHRSLRRHTGYEADRQQVNAVSHTTLPTVPQHRRRIFVYAAAATPAKPTIQMFLSIIKLRFWSISCTFHDFIRIFFYNYKPYAWIALLELWTNLTPIRPSWQSEEASGSLVYSEVRPSLSGYVRGFQIQF